MSPGSHLVFSELNVAAGEEWKPVYEIWLLIRVASGLGYWQDAASNLTQVSPEDVLLVFPSSNGAFIASRVGAVTLQTIPIDLGLLSGVLTVKECRALAAMATRSAGKAVFMPRQHPFAVHLSELCQTRQNNTLVAR